MNTMDIKPIRTQAEHAAALTEVDALWDAPDGSPEADRLDVLTLLIQAYETRRHPVPDPDPIDLLEHVMEARGLTRKDLEAFIGSRARVSEVMNRRRPLTLDMIRRLAQGLRLPADVLIQNYATAGAA